LQSSNVRWKYNFGINIGVQCSSKCVDNNEHERSSNGHGKCSWFNEPWEVEKVDPKHLAYVPLRRTILGEDGDCEVL
jgi:hypothetical protein